jgi:hypothetical protein
MRRSTLGLALLLSCTALVGACSTAPAQQPSPPAKQEPAPAPPATATPLWEKYADLKLVDVHNHDASRSWKGSVSTWTKYHVDRIALMGNVSEPAAIDTDKVAWQAYAEQPERFYPIFSGFDLHDASSLEVVRANLEQGYYGLGEIIVASTKSPITSGLKWKGLDAMDGYLPQIYKLIATYKAPILIHIDPTTDAQIAKLEEALDASPETVIIWGHANAGAVTPATLDRLLAKHPNLYIDFLAIVADQMPERSGSLADYAKVITAHKERFLLGSDSGAGDSLSAAYESCYKLLDLLDRETAKLVASGNYTRLIEAQPATKSQVAKLQELAKQKGQQIDLTNLNKRKANELIFSLSK